jgi:hypothetical protein
MVALDRPGIDAVRDRQILHGLALQWDAAVGILPARYRRLLTKPTFGLHDQHKRWGFWSAGRGQICLSRELVYHHRWDAVCEVLRHEVAHQLADKLGANPGEAPHGETFHQACRLLGANPRASGSFPLLDQRLIQNSSDTDANAVTRVQKLLSLAQSPNAWEAHAAMAKAHHLMAKYHIERLKSQRLTNYESICIGQPALRIRRESYALASLICDFYFVLGVWVPAYAPEKSRLGTVLEISGSTDHLQMAAYAHDFVSRYIDRQWDAYAVTNHLKKRRRTDFAIGIIQGFRAKMQATGAAAISASDRALVRQNDPQLQAYQQYRHPRLRLVRSGPRCYDASVMAAGEASGRRLVIHKPITAAAVSGGLLPGPQG